MISIGAIFFIHHQSLSVTESLYLEQVISVHTGVWRNFLNVNFIGTLFD